MIRRPSLLAASIFLAAFASAQVHATIPAAERQVLLNIYSSAGGANWIQNAGWLSSSGFGNGAAGSECGDSSSGAPPWYGVTCDSANAHVIGINLVQNNLIGTLPSLAPLTELQNFDVANNDECSSSGQTGCSLAGGIPALNTLSQLQTFSIDGNGFSGSIPSLTGLTNLQGIDLANNNLSGSIPSLDGLVSLQGFNVAGNSLTGSIPSLSGLSALLAIDVDRNQLSGAIPSLSGLAKLQTFYAFSNQLSGSIPSLSGLTSLQFLNLSNNQLSGAIPALSGLTSLQNFAVNGNQLTGSIPSLSGLAALNVLDVGNNQLSGAIPAAPSANLAAGQSALCTNGLTPTPDPDWDTATGVTPWYSACGLSATTVNLDQFGLTGSWYNPLTSGQGFQIGVLPDSISAGHGQMFLAWYTFTPTGAGVSALNWYTIQGSIDNTSAAASLTIYAANAGVYGTTGGNFDAPPTVGARAVGTAVVTFSDCSHGTLFYQFYPSVINFGFPSDVSAGLSGSIPLTRITSNTTCGPSGDIGAAASDFLLSGAWYNPATSGQGLVFDINPAQTLFSAGWYTFAPAAAQAAGDTGAIEPWYTLQTNSFAPGSKTANATIFTASGGFFDDPTATTPATVGTATVTFQSCTAATLAYNFTSGLNQGLTGTISLQRIGPTPAGCSL